MKVIHRYLIHEYLGNLLFITLCLASLFLIIDFFEKFRMFLSNHASIGQMMSYFFYRLPMIVSQMLPAAILLASLLTCGSLSRHNEITAMKANGISLYLIALPIMAIAVLISMLIFFLSEWVTPYTNDRAENIRLIEVQKRRSLGSFKQDQIWYRGQKGIYNFRLYEAQTNTLHGITIHYLDREMKLIMRLDAERGEWSEGRWLFHNIMITNFNDGEFPVIYKVRQQIVDLPESPSDFQMVQKDAAAMGYVELKRYIRKLQAEG
ncbi:MAG: LptF/LptG family permease, partial [Bacteroidales bacterium]|nr:LptF/LptG family permease [Bacteroidales bacterium]